MREVLAMVLRRYFMLEPVLPCSLPLSAELFRVAVTKAACERSFSHQKRVHRAERASLQHENVAKELFIRLNYEVFN